jgi:tRNA1Val (adenine37-N6)-methyltransferase
LTARTTRTTRDGLLGGRVVYEQPRDGYRVALEAPLLARFAVEGRLRPFRRVVDLGAGPGAVGLALVVTGWAERGVAVEADAAHAALAETNAQANGVAERLDVVHAGVDRVDARSLGGADLVIANPPYFSEDSGPIAREVSKASSRALRGVSIAAFARAARKLLGRDGRFVVAFPAQRLAELLGALDSASLVAKRMRFVHPRAAREAQVVFVEAKPAKAGGLVVEPPLIVRGAGEAYVAEVDDALLGRWPTPQ